MNATSMYIKVECTWVYIINLHQKHFTFVKFEIISTQTEETISWCQIWYNIYIVVYNDTKILPALSLDTQWYINQYFSRQCELLQKGRMIIENFQQCKSFTDTHMVEEF